MFDEWNKQQKTSAKFRNVVSLNEFRYEDAHVHD